MNTELTQEEASKLFSQVSQAMQGDDSDTKLSELLAQETPDEQEQPVNDTPAGEPEEKEVEVEDSADTDVVDEDNKEDESAAKADNKDKQEDEDPLAKLQAQLDELKKQQQSFSSQAGRVPSIQRRLAEYDKQLRDLAEKTSSGTSEKVKPKIEEALKDLQETDPALAKAISTAMEQALSGVDSDSHTKEIERVQNLRNIEYAEYQEEQRNILLAKYPNAPQVFGSNHWKDWKGSQPEHIRTLASSDSAEAVAMALELYRTDMLKLHPELDKSKESTAAVVDDAAKETAQKIEEERKRKQASSANMNTSKTPARQKDPADAEALFKKYSEEIRKDISGG